MTASRKEQKGTGRDTPAGGGSPSRVSCGSRLCKACKTHMQRLVGRWRGAWPIPRAPGSARVLTLIQKQDAACSLATWRNTTVKRQQKGIAKVVSLVHVLRTDANVLNTAGFTTVNATHTREAARRAAVAGPAPALLGGRAQPAAICGAGTHLP